MTECGAEHPEPGQRRHDHPGARREHGHGVTASSDSRYIALALGLIVSFLLFEVIMAFAGNSLALLADAGHMLTDAGALGASLLAVRLAGRPAPGAWTFGFKRAEVLSAQANGITLLLLAAFFVYESVNRMIHPPEVRGALVLVTGVVGILVNLLASWLISKKQRLPNVTNNRKERRSKLRRRRCAKSRNGYPNGRPD